MIRLGFYHHHPFLCCGMIGGEIFFRVETFNIQWCTSFLEWPILGIGIFSYCIWLLTGILIEIYTDFSWEHGWAKTFKKILYEEYRFFGKTVFVKTIFTKQVFVKMRCPPPSLRQLFRKSFWRFLGKSLKNLQNGVLKNLYCEFETSPWFSSKNKSQNKSDFKGTKGGWCIEVLI